MKQKSPTYLGLFIFECDSFKWLYQYINPWWSKSSKYIWSIIFGDQ